MTGALSWAPLPSFTQAVSEAGTKDGQSTRSVRSRLLVLCHRIEVIYPGVRFAPRKKRPVSFGRSLLGFGKRRSQCSPGSRDLKSTWLVCRNLPATRGLHHACPVDYVHT